MSLERKVSLAGSLYLAAVVSYDTILKFIGSPGGVPGSNWLVIPFVIVFLLAAVGIWKKPKAGLVTAVAICAVSLILVGPNLSIAQALSPEGLLAGGATTNGVFFVTLFFALFGARAAFAKPRPAGAPSFRLGRSALIGAVIFLIIFIAFGEFYGSTQRVGIINTGQADVIIAPGAGYLSSNQFYVPQSLTVKVGQTVTWKNLDNTPHTVTSDSGLFASGNIEVSGVWSFTFTKAGTFTYTCDYHSWMTGIIVVSG